MGDGQIEEKIAKPSLDSMDSVFDGNEAMPKFGGEPQPAPKPRLPSEKIVGRSHASYGRDTIQSDEAPVDWRRYVTPKDPGPKFKLRDLEPGIEPARPNAHQDRIDPGQRDQYWRAYSAVTRTVEEQQTDIASDYHAFMIAQDNPDLRALGFKLPTADWAGDASALADQQSVAQHLTTKDLFRSNGELALSPADDRAMAKAGQRLTHEGIGEAQHDALDAADHNLLARIEGLDGAGANLQAGGKEIEAAEQYIEEVKLRHEVAEDRDALEEAQRHLEAMKAGIEFFSGGLLKYAVLEAKEFGDLVESAGAMASYAIARVDDRSIDALEQKLKFDVKQLQSTEGVRAHTLLEVAKATNLGLMHAFRQARHDVLVATEQRRRAYKEAGQASAAGSGAGTSSRAKIEGAVTAIPAVELVLGLARNLATRATSSEASARYSDPAGAGFHMAVNDQRVQPTLFVGVLDQVEYVKQHFTDIVARWTRRLASLQHAQTRLGGFRPRGEIGPKLESGAEGVEERGDR